MPSSHKHFQSFTRPVASDEDQPRLYCFAYAGGSSSVYAGWARALASEVTVLGVEMPGHGSRFQETPFEDVAAMARDAADAIELSGSTAPYAFYGHSLGALVAFEATRLLQSRNGVDGHLPRHLFVGAARAPQLPRAMMPVSGLPEDEFLEAVQHRYGGLPAALFEEPELLEMVLPVLRADFKAYEQYQYLDPEPLACPVTAFHGSRDAVVRVAAVNEWSRVSENAFRLEQVEGDHFFLTTCRDVLLKHIRGSFKQGLDAMQAVLASQFSTNE